MAVKIKNSKVITNEVARRLGIMTANAIFSRAAFTSAKLDPDGRNIDGECGYPHSHEPGPELYRKMYDREGIATRVVDVYPNESWSVYPLLCETEDPEKTPFEQAWDELCDRINPWHYLHRADRISGIGHFGAIILGIDDGEDLRNPIPGLMMNRVGQLTCTEKYNLMYIRAFPEYMSRVKSYDRDMTSPRYSQPDLYAFQFADLRDVVNTMQAPPDYTWHDVHWSRVIHVADNRLVGDVFGVPRMKPVLNRLFDVRKILGGSAEMFWRGAFPGYALETNPELVEEAQLDAAAVRQEFEDFANGLKRYMAINGMTVKSLAPQVADPTQHVQQQLTCIAATLEVPLRIFLGAEAGHLASTQDAVTWRMRVARRQQLYVTPWVIRPFIDRLIALGILPAPKSYSIAWKDLNSLSDKDKSEIAVKLTQALLQYVSSGAAKVFPPMEFFTMVLKMSEGEAEAVIKAAGGEAKIMSEIDALVSAQATNLPRGDPSKRTGTSGSGNSQSTRNTGSRRALGR